MATILRLPVSTTHSIVGATLGFTLLLRGTDGIKWEKIIEIATSWILSPLLSGIVSASLYMIVDFAVLRRVSLPLQLQTLKHTLIIFLMIHLSKAVPIR